MALRWRETFPEDGNPEDLTGALRYHPFARVYRVRTGAEEGCFRWYLNGVPSSAGIDQHGVEDTLAKAKVAAEDRFQAWLDRAGLTVARPKRKKSPASPKASGASTYHEDRQEQAKVASGSHPGSPG